MNGTVMNNLRSEHERHMRCVRMIVSSIRSDNFIKSLYEHENHESIKKYAENEIKHDGQHKTEVVSHRWTIWK